MEDRLAALMPRISGGDQAALAELYDATSRLAFGLICHVLQDRASAEEVLLDVYTQAWTQAASYTSQHGSPISWLIGLARMRAIDRLRSGKSTVLPASASLSDADDSEDATVEPARQRLARTALQDLAPEQRQVIELAFCSGLNHREIAACLNRPPETVKAQLREAIFELRIVLTIFQDPPASSTDTSRSAL